jgi:hypothetical protein
MREFFRKTAHENTLEILQIPENQTLIEESEAGTLCASDYTAVVTPWRT